jgi:hypothetical protein
VETGSGVTRLWSEVGHMPEKDRHPLEELRRRRDWSYRELAEVIATETGFQRNQDCWRKICQGETELPHGPTSHAMNVFFMKIAAADKNGHGNRKRKAS